MKKWSADVWAGIVVLILSVVFLVESLGYSYESQLGPGPGFFPVWLSSLMLILSLMYLNVSWLGKKEKEGDSPGILPKGEGFRKILFTLIGLILFIALVSYLGFTVTSTLFLFMMLRKGYRWFTNLGISVSVSLFVFWLFGSVLGVSLPVNGWGW